MSALGGCAGAIGILRSGIDPGELDKQGELFQPGDSIEQCDSMLKLHVDDCRSVAIPHPLPVSFQQVEWRLARVWMHLANSDRR
jgi:hypothetical protein